MNQIMLLASQVNTFEVLLKYLEKLEDVQQVLCQNTLQTSPQSFATSSAKISLLIIDGQISNYTDYLKAWQQKPNAQLVPILFYVEDALPQERVEEILNLGITDFIFEPLSEALVVARVKACLKLYAAQQAILQQKQALKELSDTQNYLMSIVAHDLKAPLNRVQGLIQLLPLVGSLNQEQQEQVQMIDKVVESGRRLIEDILTINAYESDYETPSLELIALNDFVKEVIDMHQQSVAAKKNISIVFQNSQDFSLRTDKDSLTRILDNLISNAVKFSPPQKKVWVNIEQKEKAIQISIKDQGPGISEKDQTKMFKKFQKLTAKPTGGETSTGLGLSIIKVLTKKLKGQITYETALGKGTTFFLTLPNL